MFWLRWRIDVLTAYGSPIVILLLASMSSPVYGRLTSPSSGGDPNAGATADQSRAADFFPAWPEFELALPEGFADNEAYDRSISARAAALADGASRATNLLVQAEYLLASANQILAHQLEPSCVRRFLETPRQADDSNSAQEVESALQTADERIDRAIKLIEESGTSGATGAVENEDADQEPSGAETDAEQAIQRYRLGQAAQTLRAFANALGLYISEPGWRERTEEEVRTVASGLSPLLESEDRAVAAAALFWQSMLRSRDDDPAVVLSRLDYVNASMNRVVDRYSFWGRIHRCRVLAQHQPKPVALVLLLQLEERCFDWFQNESERDAALRAVGLVRLHVLRDWYDTFKESEAGAERKWVASAARQILDGRFAGGTHSVMRLSPCIPVVVPVPKPAPDAEN